MLKHEIRKLEQLQQQLEVEANRAIEVLHKEVQCHKHGNQDAAETIAKLQAEIRDMQAVRSENRDVEMITDEANRSDLKDEISRLHMQDNDIAKLEAKLENVQQSIDRLVMSLPNVATPCNETTPKSNRSKKKKRMLLPLGVSNNIINRANLLRAPCSLHSSSRPSEDENRAPGGDTASVEGSEKATPTKSEDGNVSSRDETPRYRRSSSVNMKKMQRMFQNAAEENVRSIRAYVTELKERVAKLQYQKQLLVCQVPTSPDVGHIQVMLSLENSSVFILLKSVSFIIFYRSWSWNLMKESQMMTWRRIILDLYRTLLIHGTDYSRSRCITLFNCGISATYLSFIGHSSTCYSGEIGLIRYTSKLK
jgi:centromeric protein E